MLRTALWPAVVSFTAIVAAAGCASEASTLSDAPTEAALVDDDDHGGGDLEGFDAPNDDPSLGSDLGEGASGEGSGARPSLAGGGCYPGGFYCGGDKLVGDPQTLYKCKASGAPELVQKCARGCTVNPPGRDDACAPVPGARAAGPVPGKAVTYPYGVKNSRYAAGYHTGEDYATPTGSNAVAVRSGTVRWSNDSGGAYGKWIGLDADNGRTYVYCHLSSRLVTSGTRVNAGDVLAKTGATGNVTGPHLHFEDHPRGSFVYGQVRKPSW